MKYFQTHNLAMINLYYTGHGEIDKIKLVDFDYKYNDIIAEILDSANN